MLDVLRVYTILRGSGGGGGSLGGGGGGEVDRGWNAIIYQILDIRPPKNQISDIRPPKKSDICLKNQISDI